MSAQLERHLLGEICTLKHGKEIWVGQVVQMDEEKFAVKLLEEDAKQRFFEQPLLWITIETIEHEIHLLDVEVIGDYIRDNERVLMLKPISDIQFQSKRQDPRLPITSPQELYYRVFPPRYYTWEKGSFLNISLGGAQFTGNKYISKGELVEIKLGQPFFGEDEVVICRNVHSVNEEGHYIFSVQFLNLQETHQKQLELYIENMLQHIREHSNVH